jgi:hypothetical protein
MWDIISMYFMHESRGSVQRLAGVNRRALRTIFAMAVFSASALAQTTLVVVYTDAFSNSVSLTLTGTSGANGVFHVTGVTGTFNGSPVSGPVSGFGSGNFYTNPAVLPANTVDSGFEFETAGAAQVISLYEYNYHGSTGYATTILPSGGSGAVTIISDTSPPVTPAPPTRLLALAALAALACIAGWRKFVVARG